MRYHPTAKRNNGGVRNASEIFLTKVLDRLTRGMIRLSHEQQHHRNTAPLGNTTTRREAMAIPRDVYHERPTMTLRQEHLDNRITETTRERYGLVTLRRVVKQRVRRTYGVTVERQARGRIEPGE